MLNEASASKTLMKFFWISLFAGGGLFAWSDQPTLTLDGISLGDRQQHVVSMLRKTAQMQREEEGQQVWKLNNDSSVAFLLIGYDKDRLVRYITELAHQGGSLPCKPLTDSPHKTGTEGNYVFTRDYKSQDSDMLAIAHGSDASHLSSCSIKRVGAGSEEEEEEREANHKKR